jgi:hypothetical protein
MSGIINASRPMNHRIRAITREGKDVIFYDQNNQRHAHQQTGFLVVVDQTVGWNVLPVFPTTPNTPEMRIVICNPDGSLWKRVKEYSERGSYDPVHNEDVFMLLEKKDAFGKWNFAGGHEHNCSFTQWPQTRNNGNGVSITWVTPEAGVEFWPN